MSEYVLYTGETVTTVSLWKRTEQREVPIYANTRGQCEWYSTDVDSFENTEPNKVSEALLEWLAEMHRRIESVDLEHSKDNHMLPDIEWYEAEIVHAIGDPSYTHEQQALLAWAVNQVSDE